MLPPLNKTTFYPSILFYFIFSEGQQEELFLATSLVPWRNSEGSNVNLELSPLFESKFSWCRVTSLNGELTPLLASSKAVVVVPVWGVIIRHYLTQSWGRTSMRVGRWSYGCLPLPSETHRDRVELEYTVSYCILSYRKYWKTGKVFV